MIEPKWKLIKNPETGETKVVWREWENGTQESCLITTEKYLAWIEAGNEPLPADE
tara:strand:+ start:343 stop:507 length:165 start_codon:yes stop_codon:yes gene_type:complete